MNILRDSGIVAVCALALAATAGAQQKPTLHLGTPGARLVKYHATIN